MEINIAPLVDVVFLLLVFFMVTSVFQRTNGLEVQLPMAKSAKPVMEQLQLVVTSNGRLCCEGREFPLTQTRSVLTAELRGRPRPVMVMADGAVPTGVLVKVLDECRLAGATELSVGANLK
ncbi:MAG: biopolymer transporter ExbD [Victivallales bacterium]|nr:biopolymer transporter ExbD [Victivallales bacterium]MBQ6528864.1 biopolymer transporter ExbD [Clostridia bacterium]